LVAKQGSVHWFSSIVAYRVTQQGTGFAGQKGAKESPRLWETASLAFLTGELRPNAAV